MRVIDPITGEKAEITESKSTIIEAYKNIKIDNTLKRY